MTVVGLEAAHMMDAYAHGYDAWGDGASLSDYLKRCSSSDKYALGEWYGLLIQSTSQNSTMKRTQSSTLVSSLILYREGFSLPEGSVGIGSVATLLFERDLPEPQCGVKGRVDVTPEPH